MPLIEAAPALPVLPDLFVAPLVQDPSAPSFAALLTQATPAGPADPVLDGHEVAGALPTDVAPAPIALTPLPPPERSQELPVALPPAATAPAVQPHAPTVEGLRDAMEQLRAALKPPPEAPVQPRDAAPTSDPPQTDAPSLLQAATEDLFELLDAPPPREGAPLLAESVTPAPDARPSTPIALAQPDTPTQVTETLPASAAELPQELPPLPEVAPVPQHVKVRVDAGLDLHVRADGDAVDVLLEGAVRAMEGLADIAPELRNELAEGGFELSSFEARTRDERGAAEPQADALSEPSESPEARESKAPAHAVPGRLGQVINAVA